MDELKEYTVLINGIPHTMLLSDEDARARGVLADAAADEGESVDKPAPRKRPSK